MDNDYTPIENQTIRVLQQLHEMTQQNCPESAGIAWYEFISSVTRSCGRAYSAETLLGTIRSALRSNGFNPKDFNI